MAAMALMSAGSQDNPVAVVNIPATGVGSPPNKPNTCPPEKRERTKGKLLKIQTGIVMI